jgi:hypothetical protein
MKLINPFSGRGVPVKGERLVGRKQLLERLVERVRYDAHCSIVGLPRLGKTSVAKEVLRIYRTETITNTTTGYLTIDAVRGPAQAYARILEETAGGVEADEIPLSLHSHDEVYYHFLKMLRRRKKAGKKGIVVIDEMDGLVRPDFDDAQLFVSRLRELANDRDRYGLTFIFVSRRSLDMIQGAVDCSTLAGLCEVMYIQPLDYDGLLCLLGRCPVALESGVNDLLWGLTGGHPFLAEVVMCEAFEKNSDHLDARRIEEAQHDQAHEFTNQYRQLQRLLSHESLFETLCELVVGPRWRPLDPHVVCLLKHYGLIKSVNEAEGRVECMSSHFKEYLALLTRTTPTWFLLGDVERQLRYLISDRMYQSFGDNWVDQIIKKHPQKLSDKDGTHCLVRLNKQREREKQSFGDAASEYLLDYAYIGDLQKLIMVEWILFRDTLSGAKNEWDKRFEDVKRIRNPMAHHRPVPSDILQSAEKSCQVFLEYLGGPCVTAKKTDIC